MRNPVIIGDMSELKTKNMYHITKNIMKRNQSICVTTNIWNGSMQNSPGIILNKKISTDSPFGWDILIQDIFG